MCPIRAIRSFAVWRPVECVHPRSDARLRRAVTRAERVRPLVWHQAPACPPRVWANGYRSAKQQAHRTPANARLAPFANTQTPFTARIRRAPSPRYRLEIATAPAMFTRPGPSPRQGACTRPLGATSSRDLGAPDAHQHARNPAREPPPHRVHPASVRGTSSRQRLKIATAPATFTRPGAHPSAGRPCASLGGYELAGPRGTRRARNPATLPLASPRRIASTPPQSGAHRHVSA